MTVTNTANGSVITLGAGNDTVNLDNTTSLAVEGGEGNDSYDVSADVDVAITETQRVPITLHLTLLVRSICLTIRTSRSLVLRHLT